METAGEVNGVSLCQYHEIVDHTNRVLVGSGVVGSEHRFESGVHWSQ